MSPRTPTPADGARRSAHRRTSPPLWRNRHALLVAGVVVLGLAGVITIVSMDHSGASRATNNAAENTTAAPYDAAAPYPAAPAPAAPPAGSDPGPATAPPALYPAPAVRAPATAPTKAAPVKGPVAASGGGAKSAPAAAGKQLRVDLTGYSYFDNSPAGSAEVANPVLHRNADGQGTFADPITVAVPSSKDFKPGTRFYLPTVQRYAIVEDTGASSGSSSSDGHLDLWSDGRGGSKSSTAACMDRFTGHDVPAELNPPPGRPVLVGPISSGGGCRLPSKT